MLHRAMGIRRRYRMLMLGRPRIKAGSFVALLALVAGLVAIVGPTPASGLPVHGIGFFKGCDSPTDVLSKTRCNFTITNLSDPDSLQITSLSDVVHGAAGDDN